MAKDTWKQFERIVCRQIAAWWYPFKYPLDRKVRAEQLPFRRTPNSGAWGGRRNRHSADVIGPPSFCFSVECKRQQAWNWDAIIKGNTTLVDSWWKQTVRTAKKQGKIPLLVFTKNNMPTFVRVSPSVYKMLKRKLGPIPVICRVHKFVYFRFDDLMSTESRPLRHYHKKSESRK